MDRAIQIRELNSFGESGVLLLYSKNTYETTVSRIKLDGWLSREIAKYKGARQGHKRAAGHFETSTQALSPQTPQNLASPLVLSVCRLSESRTISTRYLIILEACRAS